MARYGSWLQPRVTAHTSDAWMVLWGLRVPSLSSKLCHVLSVTFPSLRVGVSLVVPEEERRACEDCFAILPPPASSRDSSSPSTRMLA